GRRSSPGAGSCSLRSRFPPGRSPNLDDNRFPMMIGAALLLVALVMRSATVNRYVRSRLLISALLFGGYAAASALIAYGRLPSTVVAQLHTAIPLFLAFGLANALVPLVINPWRVDRIPEHFP